MGKIAVGPQVTNDHAGAALQGNGAGRTILEGDDCKLFENVGPEADLSDHFQFAVAIQQLNSAELSIDEVSGGRQHIDEAVSQSGGLSKPKAQCMDFLEVFDFGR